MQKIDESKNLKNIRKIIKFSFQIRQTKIHRLNKRLNLSFLLSFLRFFLTILHIFRLRRLF